MHYAMLVKAELADLEDDDVKAVENYSQALSLAEKRGHINDQAMGHQRLGAFYLRRSETGLATANLAKSVVLFARWGATAKVNASRRNMPSYFPQPK